MATNTLISGIQAKHDAIDFSKAAFDQSCRAAGFTDEWEAHRAEAKGEEWPAELIAAWEQWRDDMHAFYLARDGSNGFLGSRGL